MTRKEFDLLDSNGLDTCPDCSLTGYTKPYPNCGCPTVHTIGGYPYTRHINKWHHDCEDAKERHNKKIDRLLDEELERAFYDFGRSR